MSRQLKIRAFNPTTKKMLFGAGVPLVQSDTGLTATQDGIELILSQFIGVVDSKGQDIYEGDILETGLDTTRKYLVLTSWNGSVPFHPDIINPKRVNPHPVAVNFGQLRINEKTHVCNTEHFTVIGNVLENPALFDGQFQEESRIIKP